MAIALHAGVSARSERGAASRFGTSRSDVLSGVYAEHYERLMGYFVRRTRDRLLAEDLTHDTIVRFVRSCDTFDVSRPAWPYLKTTANNVLIDHLRRAERQVDMDVEQELEEEECLEPTPDSLMVLREMLGEALELLPDRQRIAVDLRYERGWSVPDAAEFLGVSAGTFGQLLFRARQTMKDYLEDVGTGVHGVVLPVLLALRWRWRTWSAKGREVAQTPVTAMSMEAVASVMVAASLGLAVVVTAPSGGVAETPVRHQMPSTVDVAGPSIERPIDSSTVDLRGSLPPAPRRTDGEASSAPRVDAAPPDASVTRIATPRVAGDAAGGGVEVEDSDARFAVGHEVSTQTGVDLGEFEGVIYVECDGMIGDVVCSVGD